MFELLAYPFFQRALIVGIILGLVMSVMGVFVILRRLSFFADAIGHSALTGIAAGILLAFNPFFGAFVVAVAVAGSISIIRRYSQVYLDTLLGIFFPTMVALGVIIVHRTPGYQTDLMAFLFGDIITVGQFDVLSSLVLAAVTMTTLILIGKKLLASTFDETIARADGVNVAFYDAIFLLLLAAIIALAIKLVGIILVTALLIIPAATAQNLASSLTHMFSLSVVVGLISVTLGMLASGLLSVPSGPAIILTAASLFALSVLVNIARLKLGRGSRFRHQE